ncbi:MAG: hypothetical protein JKY65_29675 [Planctomycetes bacterium]|nr:hypothetical protein [Planctomycetota bacterium]
MHERRLLQQKRRFMKSYSICPCDGRVVDENNEDWSLVKLIRREDKLRSFTLQQNRANEVGALSLSEGPADRHNMWFLPWLPDHVVAMRIPAGGPDLFFTAAINGCSVFFAGNPAWPTVYHAGTGGSINAIKFGKHELAKSSKLIKAAKKENSALFWRQLLYRVDPSTKINGALGEVNKTHYVKDGTVGSFDGAQTTHRADIYEALLREQHPALGISLVIPWASVFGFRTENKWEFFLQENCTVRYRGFATSVPMAISKVWPTPNGEHQLVYQRNEGLVSPTTLSDRVVALTAHGMPVPI